MILWGSISRCGGLTMAATAKSPSASGRRATKDVLPPAPGMSTSTLLGPSCLSGPHWKCSSPLTLLHPGFSRFHGRSPRIPSLLVLPGPSGDPLSPAPDRFRSCFTYRSVSRPLPLFGPRGRKLPNRRPRSQRRNRAGQGGPGLAAGRTCGTRCVSSAPMWGMGHLLALFRGCALSGLPRPLATNAAL